MNILITGAAGFIGFHVAQRLLAEGYAVTGTDNLNSYYDPALKQARLSLLKETQRFRFMKADIADAAQIDGVFAESRYDAVIHMAAQAGVRYSMENPHAYVQSNLLGFLNILEACRKTGPLHLVYASSSSVYGANRDVPFSVHRGADHPVSLYGATKKSNEMMAHVYAHLYGLPVTGLRFFTVYGPWGRPDMSPFIFTRRILAGEPIDVYNFGKHARDFTYIDDIVDGITGVLPKPPRPDPPWDATRHDPAASSAPYRLFNLGNSNPVPLMDFIAAIEAATGRTAKLNLLPMQPGDVLETYADISGLTALTGFEPRTPVAAGVEKFVAWYRDYYRV